MRGSITRRGRNSWRVKFDLEPDARTGKRRTKYATVRGKRADAERELTRLLASVDGGTFVEPATVTVAEHLRAWLGRMEPGSSAPPAPPTGISPKTAERYRQLAEAQIVPHLGNVRLQKLRPAHVHEWHETLLQSGSKRGKPLAARTVGHAHRVLHRLLARAVGVELLSRNVAAAVPPPKVETPEVQILTQDQITSTLVSLAGHELETIVKLALATGMRRGEIAALRLSDLDLEHSTLTVERTLEETKAGLRLKQPKTRYGRRTISLPPSTVSMLREHRRKLLEERVQRGLGKPDQQSLLFGEADGSPMRPNAVSEKWRWARESLDLPGVSFHALRHTHASALIAAGLDVVAISRRLGHANPTITLNTYAHLFKKDDSGAASAIEAAMRTGAEQ